MNAILRATLAGTLALGCAYAAVPANSVARASVRPYQGPGAAGRWFVAADGRATGDGSAEHPWDLATALAETSRVRPGDTVWVRGGTYTGVFTSRIAGRPDTLVVIRAVPGERATIDGAVALHGAYSALWGLEITETSLPGARISSQAGSDPRDIGGVDRVAVEMYAPGTKLINLVVHDTRLGIGTWIQAPDAEVYGCVIYRNGWDGPDRGHGHGIYAQNRDGTKRIEANIITGQYGYGIHVYGSAAAALTGFRILDNASYLNGSPSRDRSNPDILIGGGAPASDIVLSGNVTYEPGPNRTVQLGYGDRLLNGTVDVDHNVFLGRTVLHSWQQGRLVDNLLLGPGPVLVTILKAPGASLAALSLRGNALLSTTGDSAGRKIVWSDSTHLHQDVDFPSAAESPGNGDDGVSTPLIPMTRIIPNRYEPGRANIIVVDPDSTREPSVDLSTLLSRGDRFEIRAGDDYFGPAVARGTYRGRRIRLPAATSPVRAYVVSRVGG